MNEAGLFLDRVNVSQRVEMFPPLNTYSYIILWSIDVAGLQRLHYLASGKNYMRTEFLFTWYIAFADISLVFIDFLELQCKLDVLTESVEMLLTWGNKLVYNLKFIMDKII